MAEKNGGNWQLLTFETPAGLEAKSVIGKKVLTPSGEEIGKVGDLYMNPDTLEVEYIKISKGLFSRDYYVHRRYISAVSDESAMLSVVPVEEFKGKKVFGSEGKEVGSVKEVNRLEGTNTLVSLVVDRGIGHKELHIAENDISSLGENVVLSETKDHVTGKAE